MKSRTKTVSKSKQKKDKIKKIVAIVCAILVVLAFLASIVVPAAMAVTKEDLDKEKEKTEEAKEDLEQAEKERDEIIAQFHVIENQIIDTQNEINEVRAQIDDTVIAIDLKENEIAEAEKEYHDYQELFKVRARAMYENTEFDYLEIFFGAEDFGDLLSKIEIVSQIMKYDQSILEKLDEVKKKLEVAKAELDEIKAVLDEKAAVLDEKLEELIKLSEEKQRLLDEATEAVEAYKKILEEQEAAEAEVWREYEEQQKNKPVDAPETYTGDGIFRWPVPSTSRVSSPFGYRIHPVYKTRKFHSGIDIPAPQGSTVIAAEDGVVTYATTKGGYGQCIIIDHGSGIVTLYAHNSRLNVKVGQQVSRGQTIAAVGSTGVSTGPHLHFEVRENGSAVNPNKYLSK